MYSHNSSLQEEEARTRGTPVTVESFNAWKSRFVKEVSLRKTREEEVKLKALTAKEREEYKKLAVRLTGGRMFHFSVVIANPSLSRTSTFRARPEPRHFRRVPAGRGNRIG